jgi:hypothetical protein
MIDVKLDDGRSDHIEKFFDPDIFPWDYFGLGFRGHRLSPFRFYLQIENAATTVTAWTNIRVLKLGKSSILFFLFGYCTGKPY